MLAARKRFVAQWLQHSRRRSLCFGALNSLWQWIFSDAEWIDGSETTTYTMLRLVYDDWDRIHGRMLVTASLVDAFPGVVGALVDRA